jgi:hypothetical protein
MFITSHNDKTFGNMEAISFLCFETSEAGSLMEKIEK